MLRRKSSLAYSGAGRYRTTYVSFGLLCFLVFSFFVFLGVHQECYFALSAIRLPQVPHVCILTHFDCIARDPFASYYHHDHPPIFFGGTSRWEHANGYSGGTGNNVPGVDGAPFRVRGRVVMYANGTIRWSIELLLGDEIEWACVYSRSSFPYTAKFVPFFPRFSLNLMILDYVHETYSCFYRFEGTPLGQLGSAAGIAGSWHTDRHSAEDGDPVGPFWMWKVPNDAQRVFGIGGPEELR
jgi:hypothetical protein